MNGAQYALAALVGERPDEAQRRRSQWRQVALTVLAGLIGLAVALWLTIQAALDGWQTTHWLRFTATLFLFAPFIALALFPLVWLAAVRVPAAFSGRPVRELIESNDARLSPPLLLQPAPLPAESLTMPQRFSLLSRPCTFWELGDTLPPWALVLPFVMQPVIWLPSAFGLDPFSGLALPLSLLLGLLGLGAEGLFLLLLSRSFAPDGPSLLIEADAEGFTWNTRRFSRATHRAPWASVRSFMLTDYASINNRIVSGHVYLLDTEHGTLSWLLRPGADAAQRVASDTLAGLIVTHTGLPLRDLTDWMMRVKTAGGRLAHLRDAGFPAEALANFRAVRNGRRLRLWPFVPVCLVVFAVLVSPPQLAGHFEVAQYVYLATLPAAIHAEAPIYQSPLRANDGRWPVSPPNRVFAGGAYQLSGFPGTPTIVLLPEVYGDAAIEVTVQLSHMDTDQTGGTRDDVGLVVRANADLSDRIVFSSSQSGGDWNLVHLQVDPHGHIHTNHLAFGFHDRTLRFGVPNTLLVLMRGDAFTLYINGVYATTGTVHSFGEEELLPILPAGRVGVYVEDGANTAAFTNFAVYPVTSPPSLEYV